MFRYRMILLKTVVFTETTKNKIKNKTRYHFTGSLETLKWIQSHLHRFTRDITNRFTGKARPYEVMRSNSNRFMRNKRIYRFMNYNFMNSCRLFIVFKKH